MPRELSHTKLVPFIKSVAHWGLSWVTAGTICAVFLAATILVVLSSNLAALSAHSMLVLAALAACIVSALLLALRFKSNDRSNHANDPRYAGDLHPRIFGGTTVLRVVDGETPGGYKRRILVDKGHEGSHSKPDVFRGIKAGAERCQRLLRNVTKLEKHTCIHGSSVKQSAHQHDDHTGLLKSSTQMPRIPESAKKKIRALSDSTPNAQQVHDGLVDRLFSVANRIERESERQSSKIIGFFGPEENADLQPIDEWADRAGYVTISLSPDEDWKTIQCFLKVAELVFVDADLLGDIEDTVSFCLKMRNYAPNPSIILISSQVRGHDLTAERAAICDATLRSPLTLAAVTSGIEAAKSNSNGRLTIVRNHARSGRQAQT